MYHLIEKDAEVIDVCEIEQGYYYSLCASVLDPREIGDKRNTWKQWCSLLITYWSHVKNDCFKIKKY